MVALWQELLIHNLFVAAAHLLLGRCAQQQGKWGCQNSLPKAEEYEKQKKQGRSIWSRRSCMDTRITNKSGELSVHSQKQKTPRASVTTHPVLMQTLASCSGAMPSQVEGTTPPSFACGLCHQWGYGLQTSWLFGSLLVSFIKQSSDLLHPLLSVLTHSSKISTSKTKPLNAILQPWVPCAARNMTASSRLLSPAIRLASKLQLQESPRVHRLLCFVHWPFATKQSATQSVSSRSSLASPSRNSPTSR